MSLVQVAPGSTLALPASEWARLLAQGPTDVVTQPGAVLLVYPDDWTPAEVATALRRGSPGGQPPGVPPT